MINVRQVLCVCVAVLVEFVVIPVDTAATDEWLLQQVTNRMNAECLENTTMDDKKSR